LKLVVIDEEMKVWGKKALGELEAL